MKEKEKYIELTQNAQDNKIQNQTGVDDDIQVESIISNETINKKQTNIRERRIKEKKINVDNLSISEMSQLIHSWDPREIKDWPKRPYKTIFIVILLLLSGLLFTYMSFYKYMTDHTFDVYLPYSVLGFLLLFPGLYYTFILINILLGREGYEYSELPDLNE